jgi:hypothetical protein
LLTAIAKAPNASDKYITTRTKRASPEIKNVPSHSHPPAVCRNDVSIPCQPPATPMMTIAAKSGLIRKGGRGIGQQIGTVKPRKRIRFMDADIELRLKQELKNTPIEETNNILLTINNAKGGIADGGI